MERDCSVVRTIVFAAVIPKESTWKWSFGLLDQGRLGTSGVVYDYLTEYTRLGVITSGYQ